MYKIEIKDTDYVIILRPLMEDGKWTGTTDVIACPVASDNMELSEEEHSDMCLGMSLMAASAVVMCENDAVYEALQKEVDTVHEEIDEYNSHMPVQLDLFNDNTPTKGSA